MRRHFRSGLLSVLVLASGLVLVLASNTACKQQEAQQPKKIRQEYMPSMTYPIVVRKNDLVFGGKDGKQPKRIKWKQRPVSRRLPGPG